MRIFYKYFLLFFIGKTTDVDEVCGTRKGLPIMAVQSQIITFSGTRSRDIVDGFERSDYNSIVNKMKGRLSHFAVKFNHSLQSFFDIPVVLCKYFLVNSRFANRKLGIKNPFLNTIPCYQMDGRNLVTGVESVRQLPNQFASINHLWCQSHGVRENIFNNDNEFRAFREPQNLVINFFGFNIKTVAYKP